MTTNEMQKKLEELKDNIENALSEVAKYEELIRQIKAQEEPKFERVEQDKLYFTIRFASGKALDDVSREDYCGIDDDIFNNNNYFKTRERAQEVADKINFLLRLERLHDIYCPDYVPNWKDYGKKKYYITYSHDSNKYSWGYCISIFSNFVFFPTEEIVEKVCKILNKEREEND